MNKFYTIFTQVGVAKLANATALGTHVELTTMAVGDGNGKLPTPSEKQTSLVHEVRRAPLNSVRIDVKNPNWIICEQVIPENVGGWMIREVGLFDKDNNLIAVGNFPETYKPVVSENSGRTQTIRVVLEVSSTETMELKIDPSVVLATREYVDNQIKKATPKQLSATTKDVVDETGHTHALDMASEADAQVLTGTGLTNTALLKSALYKRGLSDFSYRIDSNIDYNDLVNNGRYTIGPGNKNAPEATGWYYLTVNRHADPSHVWAIQTAVFMTKGTAANIQSPFEYVRVSTVSGWSPWYKRWNSFSIPEISNYSQLENGYQQLPGSKIIQQRGKLSAVLGGGGTVTFPITFPNKCLNVIVSQPFYGGPNGFIWRVNHKTITNKGFAIKQDVFSSNGRGNAAVAYWQAEGY